MGSCGSVPEKVVEQPKEARKVPAAPAPAPATNNAPGANMDTRSAAKPAAAAPAAVAPAAAAPAAAAPAAAAPAAVAPAAAAPAAAAPSRSRSGDMPPAPPTQGLEQLSLHSRSQSTGIGAGLDAFLRLFPGSEKLLEPEEVEAFWKAEKFQEHAEHCTAQLLGENPDVTDAVRMAVWEQKEMIGMLEQEIDGTVHNGDRYPTGLSDHQWPPARMASYSIKIMSSVSLHSYILSTQNSMDDMVKRLESSENGGLQKFQDKVEKETNKLSELSNARDGISAELETAKAGEAAPAEELAAATKAKEEGAEKHDAAKLAQKTAMASEKDANEAVKEAKKVVTAAKKEMTAAKGAAKKDKDNVDLAKAVEEAEVSFQTAEKAEKEAETAAKAAKDVVKDAKAEEKKTGDEATALIKTEQAAKKSVTDTVSLVKKLTTSFAQAQKKVDDQENKLGKEQGQLEGHMQDVKEWGDKRDVYQAMIDAHKKHQEDNRAHISELEQKIKSIHEQERVRQINEIVTSFSKGKVNIIQEINTAWMKWKSIEAHRKARVEAFGEKEINRRIDEQKRIMNLKDRENSRRNGLPRVCDNCKKNCTNKYDFESHVEAGFSGSTVSNFQAIECSALRDWHIACLNGESRSKPNASYYAKDPKEQLANLALSAPMLDSAVWGTVEKKPDNELMLYSFETDIVTNPYDGWWHKFTGEYRKNFETQSPKNGAAQADDAFANLPDNLRPKPPLPDISILDTTGLSWNDQQHMFARSNLQFGKPHEHEMEMYLRTQHAFYKGHAW